MQAVKLPVLTGPPTKKLMFKAALRQSKCCVATRRGASQSRAAPVAAGTLPAVEGGILATRTGVVSGDANELFIAWQELTVSPAGLEARLYVSQDG